MILKELTKLPYLAQMSQECCCQISGGNKVEHNREAEWMNDFIMGMEDTPKQQKVEITDVQVNKMFTKIPNWKAQGPDWVQGYWLKNFTSMHKYLTKCLTHLDG